MEGHRLQKELELRVGLYTILLLPKHGMVYGIQTRGRGGGRVLPNSRAMVLHLGGQCR